MKRRAWLCIPFLLLLTVAWSLVSGAGGKLIPQHRAGDPGVTSPVLVHKVNPVYPEEAHKEGIQGVVVLEAVVTEDGGVNEIRVLEEPDALLTQAAADAIAQWRYEPARLEDGQAVAVFMELTVKFSLE